MCQNNLSSQQQTKCAKSLQRLGTMHRITYQWEQEISYLLLNVMLHEASITVWRLMNVNSKVHINFRINSFCCSVSAGDHSKNACILSGRTWPVFRDKILIPHLECSTKNVLRWSCYIRQQRYKPLDEPQKKLSPAYPLPWMEPLPPRWTNTCIRSAETTKQFWQNSTEKRPP